MNPELYLFVNNYVMKVLTVFCVFFSNSFYCQSIEENYKNAFYFEVLGHTRSIVSLNYERDFYRINDCFSLVARTGVGNAFDRSCPPRSHTCIRCTCGWCRSPRATPHTSSSGSCRRA